MTEIINYIFQTRYVYHVRAAEVLNSRTISSLWSPGFTLCGLGDIYPSFWRTCCLHLQGQNHFGTENGNISFHLMSGAQHQGNTLWQPKVPHLNTHCHENLETCVKYWSSTPLLSYRARPSKTELRHNGNLYLAENVYSPNDLQSRGSILKIPIRKGTCL